MKTTIFLLASFVVFAALFSCLNSEKEPPLQQTLARYRSDANAFAASVAKLQKAVEENDTALVRKNFLRSRLAYKKIEWLLAYYNPLTAKQINGPAFAEVEPSDKNTVIEPEGFGVIEPLLFPQYDSANRAQLFLLVKQLRSTAGRVQTVAADLQTTDAHVLDALRLQVFRIITLGLSGFDAPLAKNSAEEAKVSLESLRDHLRPYQLAANEKNKMLSNKLDTLFSSAITAFEATKNFESLDQLTLIRDRLTPLSKGIVALQKALSIPFFTEPRPLLATAGSLFDSKVFNADFYSPDAASASSEAKNALGKTLFYDAVLSNGGKRSCASCHHPEKAFTDGLKTAEALGGKTMLRRNTPTLINAALQPALFYDMRVSFLEDQAAEVVRNRDEMHGDFTKAAHQLSQNPEYTKQFAEAYGTTEVNEPRIKNALASYIRSLTRFTTAFDDYMQGNNSALTGQQKQGFNLFMGKAKCGTCHFLPLFNGVNPPEFTRMDAEVIGVPATAGTADAMLDADEGRFDVYKIPLHRFAFKTPTLRNVAVTAPYMHNGVYKTLEEVLEFYNRGGGKGLGISVENQTLPAEKLGLTAAEKEAVIQFLKSLTDKEFLPKDKGKVDAGK